MKKIILFGLFVLGVNLFSNISYADRLGDLEKQIEDIRKMYEVKIDDLQVQIDSLRKDQEIAVKETKERVDRKGLDVEYVGRYERPYGKGGLIIRNPSGFGDISVGGYFDHEYENFENSTATFDQHRWIINIGAQLTDRLRFYSEYEIEHGGPSVTGGEAKVEQAWMDYLIEDWINVRAGALLVPFARYNLYHDSDLQDLQDRPLVARRVVPTTWTESGAGIYGELNPVIGDYEDLTLGYEAYVINGLTDNFSDTGFRNAKGSIGVDNFNTKSIVSRVVVSPYLNHELGGSFYFGEYDNSGNFIRGTAADWFSSWDLPGEIPGISLGPLELVGEYVYFWMDEPSGVNVAEYNTGLRAQVNLHFWPEFFNDTFLKKNFENPQFTLVGRYGWAKIDDDGDAGSTGYNQEQRWTFGLNYRPVESWVFKLEYQINETDNEPLEKGGNDGFMASVAMGF